jgi:Alw26I/Eco31I/Esp3I family type II restriction endonuclease
MAKERNWHTNFVSYCEDLIKTAQFEGFPVSRNKDGRIGWVKAKGSKEGKLRTDWWKFKAASLGLPTTGKWISDVVKYIHPFSKKPCQVCGKVLSIRYEYPTKTTIKSINKHLRTEFDYNEFKSIYEITQIVYSDHGQDGLQSLAKCLKIPFEHGSGLEEIVQIIKDELVSQESRKFSPGAMSNAPDRLDGYHTYNICCRSKEDTGRHAENMGTYNQDRRAYEQWADGDLKIASKMMRVGAGDGTCAMCGEWKKMTADHIGPISLGFAHRHDGFQPLCSSCQGGKRDRLFKQDIELLLEGESQGAHVISSHAQGLWDCLKKDVKTDEEGERFSKTLKRNQWAFLTLLHQIYSGGFGMHLLPLLNPEQFFFDVEFKGVKPGLYQCDSIRTIPGNKDQYTNNAGRYIRISFDALDEYMSKHNRRIIPVQSQEMEDAFTQLARTLKQSNEIPRELTEQFQRAKVEKDKDHRSVLMLGVWTKWTEFGSPVDENVREAIFNFMHAVWDQLIKEWRP